VINGQRYWANLCRAVELVRSVDRAGQPANEQDGQWSLRPDRRRSLLRGCHYKGGTRPIFCGGKGDLGLHRYEHLYSPRMVATKRKIQITKPIYHCGKRCERNQKLGASPPEVPSLWLQRAARHRRVQVDEERTERVSGRVWSWRPHDNTPLTAADNSRSSVVSIFPLGTSNHTTPHPLQLARMSRRDELQSSSSESNQLITTAPSSDVATAAALAPGDRWKRAQKSEQRCPAVSIYFIFLITRSDKKYIVYRDCRATCGRSTHYRMHPRCLTLIRNECELVLISIEDLPIN